jgi:hypothetical protein
VKITPSYRAVNKKLKLPKNICPRHPKKKNGVWIEAQNYISELHAVVPRNT